MGIPVYEKAPDTESLLATEPSAPADEEAIEEAAAALAALDAELGRTTDPVRMYMREMGTVELLTREGEIRIAKRIEEGLDAVRVALSMYPQTYDFLLKAYEPVKAGQSRLVDVIVGFIDPNAPDVIAQPQNPTKLEIIEADDKSDEEEEGEDLDAHFREACKDHEAMIAAIADRDGDRAQTITREHVALFRHRIVKFLSKYGSSLIEGHAEQDALPKLRHALSCRLRSGPSCPPLHRRRRRHRRGREQPSPSVG